MPVGPQEDIDVTVQAPRLWIRLTFKDPLKYWHFRFLTAVDLSEFVRWAQHNGNSARGMENLLNEFAPPNLAEFPPSAPGIASKLATVVLVYLGLFLAYAYGVYR